MNGKDWAVAFMLTLITVLGGALAWFVAELKTVRGRVAPYPPSEWSTPCVIEDRGVIVMFEVEDIRACEDIQLRIESRRIEDEIYGEL